MNTLLAFPHAPRRRLDARGVLPHGMVRGIERRAIFPDDRDRADFGQQVAALAQTGAWGVLAWALLPNHAHLLVGTAKRPLAATMRALLTGYAGAFTGYVASQISLPPRGIRGGCGVCR